jgi:phosphate transport system ATP-binding protein
VERNPCFAHRGADTFRSGTRTRNKVDEKMKNSITESNNQNGTHMSEQQNPTPSSLSDVAARRAEAKTAGGTAPLGTGLEARGVHAWFDKHHALEDVSLDFSAGTVTALIGPSGCGKSTFIRTLNRMHEFIPNTSMAGQVLLDGKDIYEPGIDVTKIRLQIGMVFQKPNPFPSMTIGENVLSGLKLAQLKVSNQEDLLEECLTRAGLWTEVKDRLGAHAGGLSGGQQQRLCIARALAVKPKVLLMDEPCSALDPGSTLRIEETISQLSKSMTIVIVTHNMQQAARVSDYTAFFLSDGGPGQMIEVGPTNEIFSRPRDERTENYVTGRFG